MRRRTQAIALLVAMFAVGPTLARAQASEAGRLAIATDRRSYLPGEPIIVSLVYCTDSAGVEPQRVPPLSPSDGYSSLQLIDLSTGERVPSTSAISCFGFPSAEIVAPGECGISLVNLLGRFGRLAVAEAPMAVSLGLTSMPTGRYLLRAYLWSWVDGPASCEFSIDGDSLPASERVAVARFVEGSPGPSSTGIARERYCLQALGDLADSRYWFYAYSHTGGLADSVPLEQAMDAVGHGEGADARRARVLTRILRLPPKERRTIAARYDVPTEGRLVRFVARQIAREVR